MNPIALAIPGFFVLIAVEFGVAWRRGLLGGERPVYRLVDANADLACGVLSQVTGIWLSGGLHAGLLVAAYEAGHLFPMSATSPWVWLGAFVGLDLLYYWWHRTSHRVNALWAAHVVHHQSEDFNLAVGLRQSVLTPLTSAPFYVPLSLLGVPPIVTLTCGALNTLYQFWFHTRLVDRIGPLEWVLNTASHHRVHHGVNPEYLDKNHGGVFIVWDRLFGTFVPERDEPRYGTVEGFRSASAIDANVEPWTKIARLAALCRGWDRLRVWFAPPEWRPAYLGGPVPIPEPAPGLRWTPSASPLLAGYLVAWFLVAAVALLWLLVEGPTAPGEAVVAVALAVGLAVAGWGAVLDRRRRGLEFERSRVLFTALIAALMSPLAGVVGMVAAVVSLLVLARLPASDRTPG